MNSRSKIYVPHIALALVAGGAIGVGASCASERATISSQTTVDAHRRLIEVGGSSYSHDGTWRAALEESENSDRVDIAVSRATGGDEAIVGTRFFNLVGWDANLNRLWHYDGDIGTLVYVFEPNSKAWIHHRGCSAEFRAKIPDFIVSQRPGPCLAEPFLLGDLKRRGREALHLARRCRLFGSRSWCTQDELRRKGDHGGFVCS